MRFLTKEKSFYKSLVFLAIPIALSNLITFLITFTDSVMIGALGDGAVAGAYVGGTVATILQMLISGVESGITVTSAQLWGKGDVNSIKKSVGTGSIVIIVIGLLVTVSSLVFSRQIASLFLSGDNIGMGAKYLKEIAPSFPFFCLTGALAAAMRSIESPKIAAISSLAALIVNASLNYVLIFGKLGAPSMGISGAALATVIARIVEAAIISIYVFFIDKKLGIKMRSFLVTEREAFAAFRKYTLPLIGGQIIWIINTLFATFVIGKLKEEFYMAGFAVANALNSISYIAMNGLSGALGIIIGKTVGEGKTEKIREYSYTSQIIFIALGILTSITLIAVRTPFISLYGISDMAANIARELIGVLSVTIIGTCYQSACLIGLVKSGGDVSFILKNDAFFIFLIVIPLSLAALRLDASASLIFLALKSDQLLKCIPAAIKINRFKWIKDVTDI